MALAGSSSAVAAKPDLIRNAVGVRPAKASPDEAAAWKRYCGFLDLTVAEFQAIQNELLEEQIELVHASPFGRRLLRGGVPANADEFRANVPLTTFSDYATFLEPGKEEVLAERNVQWVHTTGAQAGFKHIPYTQRALERLLDNLMAAFILAAASYKGDVRIWPGDKVLYNTPPRPYLSGVVTFGMAERFGFTGVLDPLTSESLDFKERVRQGFRAALGQQVDAIICMTSVLVKVGEGFAEAAEQHTTEQGVSKSPLALWHMGQAYLLSKLLRRPILPKDLWPSKAVLGWGIDTPIFRERTRQYWGRYPHELYACTEGGMMGMQTWERQGMVLSPYSDFYEFISEEETLRSRTDNRYRPRTVLLGEVEPGKTYEVVISNFYAMPLMRYRVGHFIRFETPSGDARMPTFTFMGRADDRIDLAGFTRLDEKTMWEALGLSGLQYEDWTVRKEYESETPMLHLYIEPKGGPPAGDLPSHMHRCIRTIDPFYGDLEDMLGLRPLRVTLLSPGTFDRFYNMRKAQGLELGHLRPPHMNPTEDDVRDLVRASATAR